MSSSALLCTLDHGLAELRLTRPEVVNALDEATLDALVAAGERLSASSDVRVVVLSGEGRGFCSGLDLSLVARLAGGAEGRRIVQLAQRAVRSIAEIPAPVVAAIHGVAYGGGLELALAADIRIVAPDASFAAMEINWGMAPDMAGTQLLPQLVGPDRAKEMIFTGRAVGGREAYQIGLATRVADDPLQEAIGLALEVSGKHPAAIRGAKRLVDLASSVDLATGMIAEQDLMEELIGTPNQIEAMTARRANRPPVFRD